MLNGDKSEIMSSSEKVVYLQDRNANYCQVNYVFISVSIYIYTHKCTHTHIYIYTLLGRKETSQHRVVDDLV